MWPVRKKKRREEQKKYTITTERKDTLKARLHWIQREEDRKKDNLYKKDIRTYWNKNLPIIERRYREIIWEAEHKTGSITLPPEPPIEKEEKNKRTKKEEEQKRAEKEAEHMLKLYRQKKETEEQGLLQRIINLPLLGKKD